MYGQENIIKPLCLHR